METEAYTGEGSNNCRNSMDPPNPTVDMHVPYDNDYCAFWQVKKVGDSPDNPPFFKLKLFQTSMTNFSQIGSEIDILAYLAK